MRTSAPAILPVFRSEHRMRLLAVLFAPDEPELTVTEAASLAEVPVATASREIARARALATLVA